MRRIDALHERHTKLREIRDEAVIRAESKPPQLGEDARLMVMQTATILTCALLICDYIEHFAPPQDL